MGPENENQNEYGLIDDQAVSWIVKKSKGFTESESREYEQWLESDPRHRNRVEAQEETWRNLDSLSSEFTLEEGVIDPDLLEPSESNARTFFFRRVAVWAAAACIAFGVFLWQGQRGSNSVNDMEPPEVANSETTQRQRLEDGSLVSMTLGTQFEIRFNEESRGIRLLSGEAYFDVSKDPSRPFVVLAGDAEIQAVGTAFNVRLTTDEMEVLVTEGIVRLAPIQDANHFDDSSAGNLIAKRLGVQEKASKALRLGGVPDSFKIEMLSEQEIARELEWKSERLDFNATPLWRAIDSFNRRNRVQFELADEQLGELLIDGVFRSDNQEGFLRMLGLMIGAQADRSRDGRIFIAK